MISYLSLCISVYHCLSVVLSVCLSFCLYMSVCAFNWFVHQNRSNFVKLKEEGDRLSICLSLFLSVYLTRYLFVSLSV